MPIFKSKAIGAGFLAGSACFLPLAPASAEEALTLDPVVVSATRNPTPESRVASSVTVITEKEIEAKQQRTLVDVLREVPGLTVVQTGSFGGATSVFIRGAEARHTKMIIDGIDVSDPSALGVDFSQFLANDIERVEVLRGPQSGLYGSDAIGGVISVTTKGGEGPAKFTGRLEGGSFGTFNQAAGVSGSEGRISYAFNIAHNRSSDVSVMPEKDAAAYGLRRVDDWADNLTLSAKLNAALSDTLDVGFVGRYINSEARTFGVGLDASYNPDRSGLNENYAIQHFSRATLHHVAFDGRFDQTVGISYSHNRRTVNDIQYGGSAYGGERYKGDWQGNLSLAEGQLLTVGAEAQREEMSTTSSSGSFDAGVNSYAGFAQLQSDWAERFSNSLSLRYDHHQEFGRRVTWRVAPAVLIPETGTKLRASAGTGYRAPSLDNLYHDYSSWGIKSNPDLKPERSFGYDLGFEQTVAIVRFGASWFHNDIKNLITTASITGVPGYTSQYFNVRKAETEGVETFVTLAVLDGLDLRADYTYTHAINKNTDTRLARRPRHKGSLSAIWRASDALQLSASVIGAADWTDTRYDLSGNGRAVKGDDYVTVNLTGDYALTDNLAVFARVTNLFDKKVENPAGYDQPGVGVFGGVRVQF